MSQVKSLGGKNRLCSYVLLYMFGLNIAPSLLELGVSLLNVVFLKRAGSRHIGSRWTFFLKKS
jgi:hypothetical protein